LLSNKTPLQGERENDENFCHDYLTLSKRYFSHMFSTTYCSQSQPATKQFKRIIFFVIDVLKQAAQYSTLDILANRGSFPR